MRDRAHEQHRTTHACARCPHMLLSPANEGREMRSGAEMRWRRGEEGGGRGGMRREGGCPIPQSPPRTFCRRRTRGRSGPCPFRERWGLTLIQLAVHAHLQSLDVCCSMSWKHRVRCFYKHFLMQRINQKKEEDYGIFDVIAGSTSSLGHCPSAFSASFSSHICIVPEPSMSNRLNSSRHLQTTSRQSQRDMESPRSL